MKLCIFGKEVHLGQWAWTSNSSPLVVFNLQFRFYCYVCCMVGGCLLVPALTRDYDFVFQSSKARGIISSVVLHNTVQRRPWFWKFWCFDLTYFFCSWNCYFDSTAPKTTAITTCIIIYKYVFGFFIFWYVNNYEYEMVSTRIVYYSTITRLSFDYKWYNESYI